MRFVILLPAVLAMTPLSRADGPAVRANPAGKVDFNR